jgi:DNA-binding NarL/FixJ family response regulator
VAPGEAVVIRVGIVENEAIVRAGLRRVLELDPELCVAFEAADGEEGLDRLRRVPVSVVLVDVRMPGLDGVELVRRVRREPSAPPCLVLTTFDDPDVALQAIRAGARGYLLKDATLDQLSAAIRAVAGGGTSFQPGLGDALLRAADDLALSPDDGDAAEPLTDREQEVLRLMAGGYNNREIGDALSIAERTVKNHVSAVLGKLGVRDRTRAVLKALKHRLV